MFRIDRTRVNISSIQDIRANVDGPGNDGAAPYAQTDTGSELLERNKALAEEILSNAEKRAEDAKKAADEILRKARHDAQKLRADAKASGYEEGKAQAELEYSKLIEKSNESLQRVIAEIERGRTKMFGEMESELIDTCLAVIRKIATMDRSSDGDLFKSIIKKALKQIELTGKIIIRLSSEDRQRFFPDEESIFNMGDSQVTATIIDDSGLEGGDIVIETENASVLAGIESQLKYIELAFRRRLDKSDER